MKFVAAVFCLLLGCYITAAEAVSFRLNPGLNLLVLDGHKLPGSLLKGADSIELERGQHQILFTLENTANSPAFILTFTARGSAVSVVLPHNSRPAGPLHGLKNVRFRLVDEHDQEIAVIQDHLSVPQGSDYVLAMADYNRLNRKASVVKFSPPLTDITLETQNTSRVAGDESLTQQTAPADITRRSLHTLLAWFRELRIS